MKSLLSEENGVRKEWKGIKSINVYFLKLVHHAKVRNETKSSGNRRTYNLKIGGIFVRNKLYDFLVECTHLLHDKHNYEIIEYVSMEDVI